MPNSHKMGVSYDRCNSCVTEEESVTWSVNKWSAALTSAAEEAVGHVGSTLLHRMSSAVFMLQHGALTAMYRWVMSKEKY